MALFPEDCPVEIDDASVVQVRLKDVELVRPRQWGGCWLACTLYEQVGLDKFWAEKLTPSRKGTRWDLIVQALCGYRLMEPGSEWRLHRHWYEKSAMADLLGAGLELAEIHKLYDCLDRLMEHKEALFARLTPRWKDLFNAKFDVLLYDLTSTYFESDPPFAEDHLCIADPLGRRLDNPEGWLADILATHPPMGKRIARLKGMGYARLKQQGDRPA